MNFSPRLQLTRYSTCLVKCASQDVRSRRAVYRDVHSRRFDQQGEWNIGIVSGPESGFFCLLFLGVEEKYGRAAGTPSERPQWIAVSAAHAL